MIELTTEDTGSLKLRLICLEAICDLDRGSGRHMSKV